VVVNDPLDEVGMYVNRFFETEEKTDVGIWALGNTQFALVQFAE
jgi:hypothetical protein